MLSKISVLLLGIINEKPSSPYEIKKFLEEIKVKEWFPIAESSIYASIKSIYQKGLIASHTRKDGNTPEKTIYTINEQGRACLKEALYEYLASTDLDYIGFNIAGMFICSLDRSEVLAVLNEKLKKFHEIVDQTKKQIDYFQSKCTIASMGLIILKRNLNLVEAEMKTVGDLIEEIEKDKGWNHFITEDMMKEVE